MTVKHLLIGSTEAYSGKSAVILGIAHQLQQRGIGISYGKPVGTCPSEQGDCLDEDVQFITQMLQLPAEHVSPTLLSLTPQVVQGRLTQQDTTDYRVRLQEESIIQGVDLSILEGPGDLHEGRLFSLSLLQMAEALDASVALVSRFSPILLIDALLSAKQQLGDRLIGAVINDVPQDQMHQVESAIRPFLEASDIPVLATLPHSEVLRSVSVAELVHQLQAEVLCCGDRTDLLVESLKIGAMNVNSALKYFRKAHNMAVVTGGDRTDLQLAALETSTHCLILTGHIPPQKSILSRAEELEIPILAVDLDTISTVEIIEQAFGKVRLQEPVKAENMRQLIAQMCDSDRLLQKLGLRTPAPAK
ncbi:phosphotransacetylase family protein [Vacuolonema iberomarrocanum]|uniref:phosphotransacetylase family protein n=1 Tax=Vacuolonema iberomarrocanum TaxID=3454632 RepID=UPI003F6DCD7F